MDWRKAMRVGAAVVAVGFVGSTLTPVAMAQPAGGAPKVKGKDKPKKDKAPADEHSPAAAAAGQPKVGDAAPDWTAKDADGKEHKLSEYKGKIVVMDFWATWCGWCVKGMPAVQKVHEKYKDKGVVVLGMDCMENSGSADPAGFMKKKNFTYPIMLKADAAASAYGVGGIPDLFVIGPDGKIILHEKGYSDEAEATISKAIDEHLKDVKKTGDASTTKDEPKKTDPAKKDEPKKETKPATAPSTAPTTTDPKPAPKP